MIITVKIEAIIPGDLPNWDELRKSFMANMPQLQPHGIVPSTCAISAELSTEEKIRFGN